jgi:hypothetical protein
MGEEVIDALRCEVQFASNIFRATDNEKTALGIPYNDITTGHYPCRDPAFRELQHPFVPETDQAREK